MPCVFCILWDFLVLDDELVALEVVVKAHFLISSEITICTLVLLLKHVVWVVLHVPLQEPARLEFLATDVARIDRQWQAIRADYYGCNREDDLLKCAHLKCCFYSLFTDTSLFCHTSLALPCLSLLLLLDPLLQSAACTDSITDL